MRRSSPGGIVQWFGYTNGFPQNNAHMRSRALLRAVFALVLCGRRMPPAAANSVVSSFSSDGQQYMVGVVAGRCRDAASSFGLEDGPADVAHFDEPTGLVTLATAPHSAAVLVADRRNVRIRQVADGAVKSLSGRARAGMPVPGYADGASADTEYMSPSDISASPDGTWAAIVDKGKVRRLDLKHGISSTLAGATGTGFADGDAQRATFSRPGGLAVSPDGKWIAVADSGNHAIRRVDIASAVTSTLIGMETCTESCSTQPCQPTCERTGLSAAAGFADGIATQKFRQVLAEVCSTDTTVAEAGDVEIVASDATTMRLTLTVLHKGFSMPEIDTARQLFKQKSSSFIAEIASRLSVDSSSISIVCSVSNSGASQGCSGTPQLLPMGNSTRLRVVFSSAVPARVNEPSRLAFSKDGTLLIISDTGNNAIRSLNLASLTLTTVAGSRSGGAGMEDGHATKAVLTAPGGVAVSADNRIVLVAEPTSHSIRRIDLQSSIISTLAGNSTASALDGSAAMSTFRTPADVAFGPLDAWAVVADTVCRVRWVCWLLQTCVRLLSLPLTFESRRVITVYGILAFCSHKWARLLSHTATS